MTIQCPACSKQNGAGDTCVRCGCDLSMLRRIDRAARAHLQTARMRLGEGEWAAAFEHATRSWDLVHTGTSAGVACLAAAGTGDLKALQVWRGRFTNAAGIK